MNTLQQCPICFKFKLPGEFARQDATCPCKRCQGKYGTTTSGTAQLATIRPRFNARNGKDNRE